MKLRPAIFLVDLALDPALRVAFIGGFGDAAMSFVEPDRRVPDAARRPDATEHPAVRRPQFWAAPLHWLTTLPLLAMRLLRLTPPKVEKCRATDRDATTGRAQANRDLGRVRYGLHFNHRATRALMRCLHACILLVALTGCKTSHTLDVTSSLKAEVKKDQLLKEGEVRRTEIGPETITTTVEEFGCPLEQGWRVVDGACVLPPSGPDLSHSFGPTFRPHRVAVDHPDGAPEPANMASLPQTGVLLKRTVTVDHRGPSLSESAFERNTATETHATVESATTVKKVDKATPAAGCMLGLGFWTGIAVAGALIVGIGILKLKARAAAKLAEEAAKAVLP